MMSDKTDKMCQQATAIRFFIFRNQKADGDILLSDTYNDIFGLVGSSFVYVFPFFMTVAPSEIMVTAVRIES